MTHYKAGSKKNGLNNKHNVLFMKLDSNPFFNYFGIYMLDQHHTSQNMQGYAVDSTTDIDAFVRETTTLHDGTVIFRFSKELLAYIKCSARGTGRTHCRGAGRFLHCCPARLRANQVQ